MPENLENSIIKTLSWFSLFSQPLTREELWRFLWRAPKISYVDFLKKIEEMAKEQKINEKFSFLFLPRAENLIELRHKRTADFDKKMQIALLGARKLRLIPFVRAVFVCNNLSFETADAKSDIDVFVVVKDGRIWISRILATLMLSFFSLRRTKYKITNRICLSFYVSDKFLNLRSIKIKEQDIYLVYWLSALLPIYDPKNIHSKINAANVWAKEYLPNGFEEQNLLEIKYGIGDSKYLDFIKRAFEKMWSGSYGDLIENQARQIQKIKMNFNPKSLRNLNDTRVVVNDAMLKFHENDRREFYYKKWQEKLADLNMFDE